MASKDSTITKKPSNASIRRALTILKKADVITNVGWNGDGFVKDKTTIVINVDSSLVSKKRYIRKKKLIK